MAKAKLTGFSRLLLFLVIFLPATYFGASYYNGEDPVANIKGYLGMEETPAAQVAPAPTTSTEPASPPATFENVANLRGEIKNLKQELAIAEERLARCQTANVE
jgi:hypothetical protein